MSWNSEWTGKYDLWNYVNSDEAMLDDSTRPRDKFWFRLTPWKQLNKLDFWTSVKNFYLDQITAIWGKEITWISGALVPDIIPLWSWTSWYDTLPFSTYWMDVNDVKKTKWNSYTKWGLSRKYSDKWWIIIPTTWSYIIKYYSEVRFDSTQWTTTFIVALSNWVYTENWLQMYDYQSKQNVSNPDKAWWMTIQDLKAWEELYLAWMHSSGSWKKALYMWTIIIFKLS